MRLASFFAAIGPLLRGQAGPEEAALLLYPPGEQAGADARRLAIYGRFCRAHRFEAVDGVFQYCRATVVKLAGEGAWEALVEAYFRATPMRHFELNENGGELPGFLAQYGPGAGLPGYLQELADFEWWEWLTQIAPDDAEDAAPQRGPLRLGATVEVRRYSSDLVAWLDEDLGGPRDEGGPTAPPPEGETFVLFWRDQALCARRERASLIELLVLRTVSEGGTVGELVGRGSGLPAGELEEAQAGLRQAGILLGG